jgi:hypothetical protein
MAASIRAGIAGGLADELYQTSEILNLERKGFLARGGIILFPRGN